MSVPHGSWKWWVCGTLLLATMLNYMDRQTLSLTATQLKSEIHLDDERYGSLEEWFSYAFAIGAIVFGLIADRIGPRRLYPVVLIGWSLAGIATPFASVDAVVGRWDDPANPGAGAYIWLFACRTLLGFFEAGHWPCALLTARNILSENDRPFGNSILQSGASLGAVLTPIVIQYMRDVGAVWQVPFVVIGGVGLLWVPLWWRLTKDRTKMQAPPTVVSEVSQVNWLRLFFQMLTCLSVVVTISIAWQFHRAWMPKFLKEHHGYSESTANYFTSAYYLVADVGCLASGYVVKWLTQRGQSVRWARVWVFGGCVVLTACSLLIPALDRGPLLFIALLCVGAGSLGAHPQYYALTQELPARFMGTLAGLLSASSWFYVGYMQGAIGKHIKATQSYDLGMILAGALPLVGLIGMTLWVAFTRKSAPENAKT